MSNKDKKTDNQSKKKKLQEKINDWKEQYGEIYEIAADVEFEQNSEQMIFIFRKPNRQHLSRYIKTAMKNAYKAMHTLVFDTLLYPDKDKVSKMVEEKPGLIISLGNELQDIIGVNQDFFSKKL